MKTICGPYKWWVEQKLLCFQGRSQNREKRLLTSSRLSVRMSARSNLDSTRLIFVKFYIENFSKICRENSSFVKIWQKNNRYSTWRPTYTYDNISMNSYYNEKCFRQKLYRESKHLLCSISPRKSRRLRDNMEKHVRTRQVTDDNIIWRMRIACLIIKARIHAHTHNIWYALLFHDNKGFANVPKCYVIHSMSVLLLVGYAFACSAPGSTATTLIERSTCGQIAAVFVLTDLSIFRLK